jgi:tetratricopeptide (TPR) repeat protein
MGEIVTAYASVDSLDAAEREARLWIEARPRSYAAHAALAQLLDRQDRSDEALREYRASRDLLETYGRGLLDRVGVDLRTGSFASADQVLREIAETGDRGAQADGLFWLTISLRMQGRLNEALEVARKYRHLSEHSASEAFAARRAAIPEAHVLLEQGKEREAAALFDSIGAVKHAPPPNAPDSMPGAAAFDRIWALKRVGTALAAAGDTSRLSELADSVQSLGNLSAYVHDRRIHHHLRGLLWAARGRSDSAVREFEAAMYSSSDGSAETSLQLARALVRAGRPREAIHVLRAALHNFMDRAGFSTPRTEIQDALWQAYMAANERDSASVYARRVVNAWQHADAIFRDRVERARHAAAGPHPG